MTQQLPGSSDSKSGFWGRYFFWGYRQWWVCLAIVIFWMIILIPTLFLLSGVIGYVLYDVGYYDPGLVQKTWQTDTEKCIGFYDSNTDSLRYQSCELR